MNYTTLGIIAVLTAALLAGLFATTISIQAAHAHKSGNSDKSGDSVNFHQSIKQQSKCLAIVIEPVNCNNIGVNAFANIPNTLATR